MIGRVVINEIIESREWWNPDMDFLMKNLLEHLTEMQKVDSDGYSPIKLLSIDYYCNPYELRELIAKLGGTANILRPFTGRSFFYYYDLTQ